MNLPGLSQSYFERVTLSSYFRLKFLKWGGNDTARDKGMFLFGTVLSVPPPARTRHLRAPQMLENYVVMFFPIIYIYIAL